MGASISHLIPFYIEMSDYPIEFIDKERSGDLYLILFPQMTTSYSSSPLQRIRCHIGVVVDVGGASSHTWVHGTLLHLGANIADQEVFYQARPFSGCKELMLDCIKIGRIENIGGHSPYQWAKELDSASYRWYLTKYLPLHGKTWNALSNCHQFSRFLVRELGMEWPEKVLVTGDVVPEIVDLGFLLTSCSARFSNKFTPPSAKR
eukprot:TRINITY_DN12416_c0_g1_i1.p1 TRINITY_DN12416_c0_g1~~TRINITY_DN12416_c0_g1_i1.p1  ORF type:complete len:205 (+),score=0.33 TRINITY_DN12416_c0_g1_i1:82-696(+)